MARTDVTPIGRAVYASRASINDLDEVAFTAMHEALYVLRDRKARAVVRTGDDIPGAGMIETLGSQADAGSALVFSAYVTDAELGTRAVLAAAGPRGPRKLVADGDPTGVGGTLDLRPADVRPVRAIRCRRREQKGGGVRGRRR